MPRRRIYETEVARRAANARRKREKRRNMSEDEREKLREGNRQRYWRKQMTPDELLKEEQEQSVNHSKGSELTIRPWYFVKSGTTCGSIIKNRNGKKDTGDTTAVSVQLKPGVEMNANIAHKNYVPLILKNLNEEKYFGDLEVTEDPLGSSETHECSSLSTELEMNSNAATNKL